jgi:hypothetical protein
LILPSGFKYKHFCLQCIGVSRSALKNTSVLTLLQA